MVTKPHWNSKRDTPFQRLLPSTRDKLKNSIHIPKSRPRGFLDEVYRSSGDVVNVHQIYVMLEMLQEKLHFPIPIC